MFSGPMFRREYLAATRRRRLYVYRTSLAIVFGGAMLLFGYLFFAGNVTGEVVPARLALFGRTVFVATICLELLFLVFFIPVFVGGAIAEEREKDTLPWLLLTRLTPFEIVATKGVARWLPVINLAMTGLPVLVASAWLGGLGREGLLAVLGLFSGSAFMASLAIAASAQRMQAGAARAHASAWIFAWLLMPPILTIIPIRSGGLWGDLLFELKRLCSLLAPSSPLSLVTDRRWFTQPRIVSLEERVALMVVLQALFGLLAFGIAASRLKARERNPNWLDPTRGYRPPCGDDPIFWREFDLPTRRGGGSLLFLRLRTVSILVRAILMNLLMMVAVLLALAIPLGLLAATVHFGFAAFQELWHHGYSSNGPFDDRADFNLVVRAATGLLGLFPALIQAALVSGRITTERDRKTWDALLTTPLGGEEILRSKARAALHGIWQAAWPLPVLWALGLASNVVLPIGILLAALDLLLTVWGSLALGLFLSIRPGTTSDASSRVALISLLFFLLHTPLLYAALASPREYAVFASWDFRLRWGLVLAGLLVPILTGTVAWSLTTRTIERFDEWVGRPCKAAKHP